MKRRTIQDLIERYRRSRKTRNPEKQMTAAAELGQALAETGVLAEIASDNMTVILWQPVAVEGGPDGFAHKKFRNTAAVGVPKFRPQAVRQLEPA